jgi:RimJ/RimL family protein N-acetyltransferase
MPPSVIRTQRLILRPFNSDDANEVQRLAGDRDIAVNVLPIPHPYPVEFAIEWISLQEKKFSSGEETVYAITLHDGTLIGSAGLRFNRQHGHAELGYWIGKQFWGKGFATEAGLVLLRQGFKEAGIVRIYSRHMAKNPASGRVMAKLGMKYEGCLRRHVKKFGIFEDVCVYSVLNDEFKARETE